MLAAEIIPFIYYSSKGDALLQKVYTTDFLTKKKKKNEGEVPQYYVRENHPAIIDERTFALVQTKLADRTSGKNRLSSVSIFSSKIMCGDCGSWYGSKVWHSKDKYRRVIWQCNKYFQPDHHDAIVSRSMWNAAQRILNSRKYGHEGTYLTMRIIDHGALTGYISMNRTWAGFDFEDYYRAGQITMGILDEDLTVDLGSE